LSIPTSQLALIHNPSASDLSDIFGIPKSQLKANPMKFYDSTSSLQSILKKLLKQTKKLSMITQTHRKKTTRLIIRNQMKKIETFRQSYLPTTKNDRKTGKKVGLETPKDEIF